MTGVPSVVPPIVRSVVLASSSPRRRELLERLGLDVEVRAPHVDESPRPGERAEDYVVRLAVAKAATAACDDRLVIAADTTVELDGHLLGKPADGAEAFSMLRALSGRTHRVHSGVAVRASGRHESGLATTSVSMVVIGEAAARWYVSTGEPVDKAGAYAVQGVGAVFVEHVRGCVTNVIGLPLTLVAALAARSGYPLVPGDG